MFFVKCPKCNKQSKGFVDHDGQMGECPYCHAHIPITEEPQNDAEDSIVEVVPLPDRVKPERRRRAVLPNTSPPALSLAVAACGLTWVVVTVQPGREQFAAAWQIVASCGWIGTTLISLFIWGLFMLGWKAILWARQRRPLCWQVFPEAFQGNTKVGLRDVDGCLAHLDGLLRLPRRSILLNRVYLGLEHYRQTSSVQEVRGALTGQSAIDANLLDSSYAIIRFLIWVIPILGFIGTVMGIGVAVAQFADFIPQVSDPQKAMESLREGLGGVTQGLGTAFNTTLVALCLVAPLMLATSWLRRFEECLLAEIDQFSNHTLLSSFDSAETER